jgi:hypothetical protein
VLTVLAVLMWIGCYFSLSSLPMSSCGLIYHGIAAWLGICALQNLAAAADAAALPSVEG